MRVPSRRFGAAGSTSSHRAISFSDLKRHGTPISWASHLAASDALYRIKDRAFHAAAAAVHDRTRLTEYELQQRMVAWFEEEGLVSDSAPVVAIGANTGNPHYLPTATRCKPIVTDEVLLLDLWGKQAAPGSVFADITWVGVTGTTVPQGPARHFAR